MVDYVKSAQTEGFDIHDFTLINFTAAEQQYIAGTNMYGALLTLQPDVSLNPKLKALRDNPDTGVLGFTAHKELFYATQNCWIYLIQPGMLLTTRLPVLLLANAFYTFNLKVCVIYVVRQVADGILYCWLEG